MEDLIPRSWYSGRRNAFFVTIFACFFFGPVVAILAFWVSQAWGRPNFFQNALIPIILVAIWGLATVLTLRSFRNRFLKTHNAAMNSGYEVAAAPPPPQFAYRYRLPSGLKERKKLVPGVLYLGADDVTFVPNINFRPKSEPVQIGEPRQLHVSLAERQPALWRRALSNRGFVQVQSNSDPKAVLRVPAPEKTIERMRDALLQLSLNLQHPPRQ
jgi:hypothetical protein